MVQPQRGHVKDVAIIGAGPSGLVAAKFLLAEKAFSNVVIYEQRDTVGGTWNYAPLASQSHKMSNGDSSQHVSTTAKAVVTANLPKYNTPMYEGLETNVPHMLMGYCDTPFPENTKLFPDRECVMQYLEDYASELSTIIKFKNEVLAVKPTCKSGSEGWDLTTRASDNGNEATQHFDAVVIANGHGSSPSLPPVQGLDEWAQRLPESICHSISFRNTKPFKNKRVLLVGGGPSAADISHQLTQVCALPLLASRPKKSPYHLDEPNERAYLELATLIPEERAAVFKDGSIERDIDIIFLCTGYTYDFDFLGAADPAVKAGEGIGAIHPYQYIFHVQHPTLAFVETLEQIIPFAIAEAQAAVIARVWSGRLALPSSEDMQGWVDGVISKKGPGRKFHATEPPSDLQYMKEMYEWCRKTEASEKGKLPRLWDDYWCWLRMATADIKKAFVAKGEDRGQVVGYEELGFHFSG
ncbi:uncharacterized protein KY384_007348 [Bacidia gigantensis]|uniref:uncharacterized protein n=1 Tax=Bacidia gigantensis TaxID=2732470 RepID=UPI001D04472E|nr:uncharacterized protein KY384_007348 [Bacidia gigantensis]KAG8528430.1 hypothetical protein KY384_007348 [Bacidia gigantensis]